MITWSFACSFTYTIADAGGDVSDIAAVTIAINRVNDAPVLMEFTGPPVVTSEDMEIELTGTVLDAQISYADAEDPTLQTFKIDAVLSGTLSIGGDAASATPYTVGSNELIQSSPGSELNAW